MLSPQELDQYWEQGFVVCRGLIDGESLERWDRRFRDLVEGRVEAPRGMRFVRDVMIAKGAVEPASPLHAINKILAFEGDPVLFEYAKDPRVLERVRSVIGRDVMTIVTNVIHKPPFVDARHPLHQDQYYFPLEPADRIIGTWAAVERATRENGCLSVIPGTHRQPVVKHSLPDWEYVNAHFYGIEDVDLDARVHVELEPGDCVFFHPCLFHGSGRNRTSGFRRAMVAHFASAHCAHTSGPEFRARGFRRLD
ncbi:MAG: phytanoyl-CoA dioxygenase family protein [Deltaproteobacteria bacterium]|nr:phytanoyl-CoA dioxygenase family protein [Deltaproteobacteria bacterium]